MLSARSRRNKVTALGARYRVHRERRHLSQRLRQPQTAGDQARQLADPGPQVGGISADCSEVSDRAGCCGRPR
jgi:hypothetical protein